MNDDNLQEEFAKHFARDDIEGAKFWINKWAIADEQLLPGQEPRYMFSQRAMAGHLSDYLEGFVGSEPDSYNGGNRIYWDTKHGPQMYWAIGDSRYMPTKESK